MKFRQDINGLRAISVMIVVFFHFNANWLPGGFVGVDIFFVLSGFLMTKIIFDKLEDNRFSILQFYKARAKRIIPALTVMLTVVTIYCWFNLFDVEFEAYLRHLFSSLLFYSNIIYWQEAGYFSANAHENWLLHTWSLSVEWQFYIIYPVVISALLLLLSKKIVKALIVFATVASFGLGVYATDIWPDPAYFSLPTRAWQMLTGAIIFLFPIPTKYQSNFLVYIGLGCICFSAVFFSSSIGWPGVYAALPIIGAALVMIPNNSGTFGFFNLSPIVKLGKWSYSIYLWHWPIVVFLNNQSFSIEWYHNFIGILVSIFLGFLSYQFVEQSKFFIGKFTLFAGALLFANFAYAFSIGTDSARTMSSNPGNQLIARYNQERLKAEQESSNQSCRVSANMNSDNSYALPERCINLEFKNGLMVWGDSHAEAITQGFEEDVLRETGVNIVISSGCRPTITNKVGTSSRLRRACDEANSLAKQVVEQTQPETVIIAMKDKHEETDWDNNIAFLKENGVKNIIIIGPTPQWYPSVPLVYVRESFGKEYLSDNKLDPYVVETDQIMSNKFTRVEDVNYVSIINELCLEDESTLKCKVDFDGSLISFDYGHLNKDAATYLSHKLLLDLFQYKKIENH
ncbi:acyltransferase family protein [Glaciecola sp. 1036]|uniref:acyltransferase family protein n=1 Tax=Alteromonadaceae TaxID=72275 RepID=UPI003CFF2711